MNVGRPVDAFIACGLSLVLAAALIFVASDTAWARSVPEHVILGDGISSGAAAAFSPDGATIAAIQGPFPQTIGFWSLTTGAHWSVPAGASLIDEDALTFSADGSAFAVGEGDSNRVQFRDVHSGQPSGLPYLLPAGEDVRALLLSGDRRVLVAGTGIGTLFGRSDGSVFAWHIDDRHGLRLSRIPHAYSADDIATDRHGRRVAAVLRDGRLRVFDRRTRRIVLSQRRPRKIFRRLDSVEMNASGRFLVTLRGGGELRLWHLKRRRPVSKRIPGAARDDVFSPGAIALSPDGRRLAFLGPDDVTITVWNVRTGSVQSRLPIDPCEHRGCGTGLAWDPRGERLAVTDGPRLSLWDLRAKRSDPQSPKRTKAASRLRAGASEMPNICVHGHGSIGSCGDGGPALAAKLAFPRGLAALPNGGFVVADAGNNRIRAVDASGRIDTIAGSDRAGFSGDGGPAIRASLRAPGDLARAFDGSLLIADEFNGRVRRIDPDGRITTVAGRGRVFTSTGDGGPATAAGLVSVSAVAARPDGGFYIADQLRVRLVTPDGRISTIAGNGATSPVLPSGLATASAVGPRDLAWAPDGSLLIVDDVSGSVRKLLPSGVITPAAEHLNSPFAVAPLPDGGMVVLDNALDSEERSHVVRLSSDGTATVIAGGGDDRRPAVADATHALLQVPDDLAVTSGGGVLVSETSSVERVRLVTADGQIRPVAGSSEPGDAFQGDSGYDSNFNGFYLTGHRNVRAGTRLRLTYTTTRACRIQATVRRRAHTVARGRTRAMPGRGHVWVRGSLRPGRYTAVLVARAGGVTRKSKLRLRVR
jgi:WD40 repeat protein